MEIDEIDPAGKIAVTAACVAGVLLMVGLFLLSSTFVFPALAAGSVSAQDQPVRSSISLAGSDCQVSPQFSAAITQWCELITYYAGLHGLDADLLAALILQESGGNPQAYSHSGAVGLMQVMPRDGLAETFICVNGPCFVDRPSMAELFDPEFNIAYGTGMLAELVSRKGDLQEALKLYGPMDAGYSYANKVLTIYERYRD